MPFAPPEIFISPSPLRVTSDTVTALKPPLALISTVPSVTEIFSTEIVSSFSPPVTVKLPPSKVEAVKVILFAPPLSVITTFALSAEIFSTEIVSFAVPLSSILKLPPSKVKLLTEILSVPNAPSTLILAFVALLSLIETVSLSVPPVTVKLLTIKFNFEREISLEPPPASSSKSVAATRSVSTEIVSLSEPPATVKLLPPPPLSALIVAFLSAILFTPLPLSILTFAPVAVRFSTETVSLSAPPLMLKLPPVTVAFLTSTLFAPPPA